jgi:NAD(P)-dependent dehydrogenase (short-subunit alcohol dehydrogenase family)
VRAKAYQANVSVQPEIEAVVQQVAKDFGRLDIMVVNSGIVSNIAAEDYTTDQWSEIMKVNLDGAFYSAQAAGRIFREQGHGNVIFTASVSATLVNVPQKQAAVSLLENCIPMVIADIGQVQCLQGGRCPVSQVPICRMG